MSKKFRFDLGVDDKYLKAIGQVAIQWACFECAFDLLILVLDSVDKRGSTGHITVEYLKSVKDLEILESSPFKKRKTLLKKLANKHILKKDFLTILFEKIDRSQKLRDHRDIIIHGAWGEKATGGVVIASQKRYRKIEARKHFYSLKKIEDIAWEISELNLWFESNFFLEPKALRPLYTTLGH